MLRLLFRLFVVIVLVSYNFSALGESCPVWTNQMWFAYHEELEKKGYSKDGLRKACFENDKKVMEDVNSLRSKNVQTKETPNNNVPKTVVQPQISELSDEQIDQVSNDLEELELDLGGGKKNAVAQRAAAEHSDNDKTREQCKKFCNGDGNCTIDNDILYCKSGGTFNWKTGKSVSGSSPVAKSAPKQKQSKEYKYEEDNTYKDMTTYEHDAVKRAGNRHTGFACEKTSSTMVVCTNEQKREKWTLPFEKIYETKEEYEQANAQEAQSETNFNEQTQELSSEQKESMEKLKSDAQKIVDAYNKTLSELEKIAK